jgi:repressor LexA
VRLPGREAIRLEVEDLADAVDIPSRSAAYVPVPLVGQIAAGVRNLADQVIEDTFVLPRQLVGDGTLFLLRVHGESMINAAIADGDLVVVRQQEKAENGDIVAAMIDGEATVKTFRRTKDHIWLMPHNPAYTPFPAMTPPFSAR